MVRAGLISMLYSKTTELKSVQLQDSAAITLMGTDVERIVVAFKSIHEVWASLLDIGIAIWLLERQIFVACVVPAIIAVCKCPLSYPNRIVTEQSSSLYPRYDEGVSVVQQSAEAVGRTR